MRGGSPLFVERRGVQSDDPLFDGFSGVAYLEGVLDLGGVSQLQSSLTNALISFSIPNRKQECQLPFDQNALTDFLRQRAYERWEDEEPFYLSMVAPELKAKQIDYREATGTEKLKDFARRLASPETFKVVEHPTQRAKVAVTPYDAQFEFENDIVTAAKEEIAVRLSPKSHSEKVLIDFLRELARLSDADQDSVVIPVKVITKLISR